MGGSLKGKNGVVGLQRYVERGVEDELIKRLEKHESVALVGLPGVGKSTTARMIVLKLQENGYIPVLIKPSRGGKPPELLCERFIDTDIPCIGVSEHIGKEEFKLFISMVAYIGRTLEKKPDIMKDLEPSMKGLKSSLEDISSKLERGLIAESVALEMARSAAESSLREFLNSIGGFLDRLGLSKFIDECVRSAGEILTAGGMGVILAASAFPASWLVSIAAIALARVVGAAARSWLEKEMLEGILESTEAQKVVLVIDDLSTIGFGFRGGHPLVSREAMRAVNSLLSRLLKRGVKTVHVVRIDFEEWPKYRKYRVKWLAKHGLANVRQEEQVVELLSPRPEIFAEIIRANVGDVDEEIIARLYRASGGIPALALMIYAMGEQTLREILSPPIKEALWPTFDEVAALGEELRKAEEVGKKEAAEQLARELQKLYELALRNTYRAAKVTYEDLRESKFSYAALVAQPLGVAEDELREFCQRTEEYRNGRGFGCKWILEGEEIVETDREQWFQEERKFYSFNELWAHLPPLILTLSEKDEELAREMALARKLLLEIMYEKSMRFGRSTGRMILSALRHIAWLGTVFEDSSLSKCLIEVGITSEWLAIQALYWGHKALLFSPLYGIRFVPVASHLFSRSAKDEEVLLHAAVYSIELADAIAMVSMPPEELIEKLRICEDLIAEPCEDPAVIAHRAIARAAMIRLLLDLPALLVHIESKHKECLNLLKKLEEEDSEKLKLHDIARVVAGAHLGDALRRITGYEEEAEMHLKSSIGIAEKVLKELNEYASDEHVEKFLKPLGGNTREGLEIMAKRTLYTAQYNLALLLWDRGQITDAKRLLEGGLSVLGDAVSIRDELVVRSRLLRLEVIERGLDAVRERKDGFGNLWKRADKWKLEDPDVHDFTLAEYMLACLINDRRLPAELLEKFVLGGEVYQMLLGMVYLVEEFYRLEHRVSRDKVLEELTELIARNSIMGRLVNSLGYLASIVSYIIEGHLLYARKFARHAAREDPLFKELAEALEEGWPSERVLEALVKLFYLHF
ncbi:MAG: ATP-binding protein [Thermofilaceae archaeon]